MTWWLRKKKRSSKCEARATRTCRSGKPRGQRRSVPGARAPRQGIQRESPGQLRMTNPHPQPLSQRAEGRRKKSWTAASAVGDETVSSSILPPLPFGRGAGGEGNLPSAEPRFHGWSAYEPSPAISPLELLTALGYPGIPFGASFWYVTRATSTWFLAKRRVVPELCSSPSRWKRW